MADLTSAQIKALHRLSRSPWATPSEIGEAMSEGQQYPMKAQGAGRLGGIMAWRLIKLGLASSAALERGGFPAYRITQAGRIALKEAARG